MELQRPNLYAATEDGASLALRVALCDACGTINFPPDVYGCARCGAAPENLRGDSLDGSGVLRRFVTLHKPLLPGLPAPAVIGEVALTDDLVVEARINCEDESELYPGLRVQARGHAEEHDGVSRLACRFYPLEVAP